MTTTVMTNTEPVPPEPLDPLARRITDALQVNGRASWRRIAQVLDEPVRTVSRRGAAMLEDGSVHVVGLRSTTQTHLLRVRCRPESLNAAGRALADWPETVFVYALAEQGEVIAELMADLDDVPRLLDQALPAVPGVLEHRLTPVLHYYRTVAGWRPGGLGPAAVAALELAEVPAEQTRLDLQVDDVDRAIIDAIVVDGRATLDTIAALGGFSEATARRRIDQLLQRGLVRIRAVVDPALLGLPVETLVWIRCAPRHVERIGTELAASPLVRYAAMVTGEHPLVADVTTRDLTELRAFLTEGDWVELVEALHPTLVVRAFKRSGVLSDAGLAQPAGPARASAGAR